MLPVRRLLIGNSEATGAAAALQIDLDLVFHEEPESHLGHSIDGPGAYDSSSSLALVYIESNIIGTFHLLQPMRAHREQLLQERQEGFGSLGYKDRSSETTPNEPPSPYSASKVAILRRRCHRALAPQQPGLVSPVASPGRLRMLVDPVKP